MNILKYGDLEKDSLYSSIKKFENIYIIKLIKIMMIYKKTLFSDNNSLNIELYLERIQKIFESHSKMVYYDVKFNNLYTKGKKCKFTKSFYESAKKILNHVSIKNPFEVCKLRISNIIPKTIESDIEKKNNAIELLFNSLCNEFTLDLDRENLKTKNFKGMGIDISFEQISNIRLINSDVEDYYDAEFTISCKIILNGFVAPRFYKNIDHSNYSDFKRDIKNALNNSKRIEKYREKFDELI